MKIEVTMKSGWIVRGELKSRRTMLTFISVPSNEVDKKLLGEMLMNDMDGLYEVSPKSDGSLDITLENIGIQKVVVK